MPPTRLSIPSWLLALAAILLVLIPVARRDKVQPLGAYDQEFYIGIAYDLVHAGRFTDGFAFAIPTSSGERPPGMRFAPLYPALLAVAMTLEPGFRTAGDCVAEHYDTYPACPNAAHLVRTTQTGMLAAIFLMIWWLAGQSAGPRGAWIGLALALVTAPYLMRSADYAMTEMTTLFLTTAATSAAFAAVHRPYRRIWAAATGLLLGLVVLTRPAFLYLFDAAILVGVLRVLWLSRADWRPPALLLALFVAGFAMPVAPWVVRNAIVLDRPALSFGYASHTLVQRISYNAMTSPEYAMSYVCGLPDGTSLGERIAGPGACDRFGLDLRPGTFYQIGTGPLLTQTLDAAGGYDDHLAYLLRTYILPHPLKHLLVTIPMALRGAWVDHYWGLLLAPACLWLTLRACRRRDTPVLVLTLPAWFMLAFNAAIAVNQVRYNLMLVVPFGVAGAIFIERLLTGFSFSPPWKGEAGGGSNQLFKKK